MHMRPGTTGQLIPHLRQSLTKALNTSASKNICVMMKSDTIWHSHIEYKYVYREKHGSGAKTSCSCAHSA